MLQRPFWALAPIVKLGPDVAGFTAYVLLDRSHPLHPAVVNQLPQFHSSTAAFPFLSTHELVHGKDYKERQGRGFNFTADRGACHTHPPVTEAFQAWPRATLPNGSVVAWALFGTRKEVISAGAFHGNSTVESTPEMNASGAESRIPIRLERGRHDFGKPSGRYFCSSAKTDTDASIKMAGSDFRPAIRYSGGE